MLELYKQLSSNSGSREVELKDTTVTTSMVNRLMTVKIKSLYVFRGSTNIRKDTQNLIQRTTTAVKLEKIEIIRTTNIKNVTISIRFLSMEDVLIFNESDNQILNMADETLLRKIGIEVI